MNKLELVITKINSVYSLHKFAKKAKAEKIKLYTEKADLLEQYPIEKIEAHDFASEILTLAFNMERSDYVKKHLSKRVKGLERHLFSPEQNTLHFKNGKMIRVSGADSIDSALRKITYSMNIEDLKKI